MNGDLMVVGVCQDRTRKIGSVYIYQREDEGAPWSLKRKLAPPNDGNMLYFGMVVAI